MALGRREDQRRRGQIPPCGCRQDRGHRRDGLPEGLKEKIGGALGFDDRRVKQDLERLESLLDERGGRETGAWRGEQH